MFIVSGMITTSAIISDVSRRPQVYMLCLVILVQSAFFAISSVISMSGMPATVRSYTLTSSIEMLKNREVIEEVLLSQKSEKNARAYRVFQAMRLMRREYMKMVSIGDFNLNMSSSDTCSDYGSEEGTRHHPSMSVASEIQMPEQLGQNKRLKDIAVKTILENFQRIGKPGNLDTTNDETMRRLSYRYTEAENGNWAINVENVP